MNWVFKRDGFLDWIFGRWCGGFDDRGINCSRELDYDKDNNI